MKKIIIILFLAVGSVMSSCDLTEDPVLLANQNVYNNLNNAQSAVKGIYAGLGQYNVFGQRFLWVVNINSGFTVTKRGGNNPTSPYNSTWASLKPTSNDAQMASLWQGLYSTINRANNAIQYVSVTDNPLTTDESGFNDVAGHAYFVRAYTYFNLVRLWGDVPLRDKPATSETIHLAKAPSRQIYDLIISDAQKAATLINGSMGAGYPKNLAANMLLAKVYMTLATAPTELQGGVSSAEYWQLAYDEAIKLYGQYSLLNNYGDLFHADGNSDNTSETIFEIQFPYEESSDHRRSFGISNYISVNTFGWLRVHIDVHDIHANTYPGDPRIDETYVGAFFRPNGNYQRGFPDYIKGNARGAFGVGFPFLFKYTPKDQSINVLTNNGNFVVYRYADLLLMLAEISNELQNGEELGYVTEVLARAGQVPHAGYTTDQPTFRDAIMKEYQFELMGEGHDWFNNRRRGFDYFKTHVIDPHNYFALDPDGIYTYEKSYDLILSTDPNEVMSLPIPDEEIRTNNLIN